MISQLIASILPYLPKKFIWLFSKKYIAGASIKQAIKASKKLNQEGIVVTVDLLGEFIQNMDQAEYYKNEYLHIINTFEAANITGNYSLKPTSFGLLIDKEQCFNNIREIVELAHQYNNFVRIDMEDSKCVDLEINLYERLRKEFPSNVGLVLQAYLYRTESDIDNMLKQHTPESPLNFRLCKGIYIEPENIAIKDPEGINTNYLKLLNKLVENNIYVGIATHDKLLIEGAQQIISKHNIPQSMYEYQMLYGVTLHLRNTIVANENKMRVYVPYGKEWFKYSVRRLKENPEITTHILKSIFSKN